MLEKVAELVKEQLDCGDVEITGETSFKDDLGADSLDLYELVMLMEETFDVTIPTEDFANITTVGEVVAYLQSKGIEA